MSIKGYTGKRRRVVYENFGDGRLYASEMCVEEGYSAWLPVSRRSCAQHRVGRNGRWSGMLRGVQLACSVVPPTEKTRYPILFRKDEGVPFCVYGQQQTPIWLYLPSKSGPQCLKNTQLEIETCFVSQLVRPPYRYPTVL